MNASTDLSGIRVSFKVTRIGSVIPKEIKV